MAGELRCKAIRYKTALPLIQGGPLEVSHLDFLLLNFEA